MSSPNAAPDGQDSIMPQSDRRSFEGDRRKSPVEIQRAADRITIARALQGVDPGEAADRLDWGD